MSEDRAARFPALRSAALVALLLTTAFLQGVFPLWDTDFWWNVRTGQLIYERHAVPQTDWFGYVDPGQVWIDPYWLFQVVLAGLYAAGGVVLATLVKSGVGAAIVATSLVARERRWPVEHAALVWAPALISLGGHLYERPEIVSLWLVAAYLAVLFHARSRPGLLWLLVPLQILWVNCHGFFVFGLFFLGLYWIELAWDWRRGAFAERPHVKQLTRVTLAVTLACLVNPYGWRIFNVPVQQFIKVSIESDFWGKYIGELRSIGNYLARASAARGPDGSPAGLLSAIFASPYAAFYFALVGLAIGVAIAAARRGQLRPMPVLLCVTFTYLGWNTTRNTNFFAVVVATATTWNWGRFWDAGQQRDVPRQRRRREALAPPTAGIVRERWFLAATVALLGLALATVTGGLYAWAGEGREFGLGEREDWFMHDAAKFAGREGMPSRAFVLQIGQASLYTFHNGPQRKIFVDGRLEVSSRAVYERYLAIQRQMAAADPSWERELENPAADPHSVDRWPVLLVERDRAAAQIAGLARTPHWRAVYADAVGVVFLRDETADQLGLPAVRGRR